MPDSKDQFIQLLQEQVNMIVDGVNLGQFVLGRIDRVDGTRVTLRGAIKEEVHTQTTITIHLVTPAGAEILEKDTNGD